MRYRETLSCEIKPPAHQQKNSNCLMYLRLWALFPALQTWRRVREMAQWRKTDLAGPICMPALLQWEGKYNEIPRKLRQTSKECTAVRMTTSTRQKQEKLAQWEKESLESCPFSTHCNTNEHLNSLTHSQIHTVKKRIKQKSNGSWAWCHMP